MLEFLPVLFFLVMSYATYHVFKNHINIALTALLVVSCVGHVFISDLGVAFYVAQGVAAVLLFFLMVTFIGNKTSLSTILTVCGVVALAPGFPGIIAMVMSLVGAVLVGIISMMKTQNRTIQQVSLEVAATSGMLGTLPDIQSLPDREEVGRDTKVVSIAPYFFFPFLLVGIATALL